MQHEVIMPALGMAQETGLIVSWLKQPGDVVRAGDALFEVETDKATMEVEAPADGYLASILAEAGEEAPVGDVIAIVSKELPTGAHDRDSREPGRATRAADEADPPATRSVVEQPTHAGPVESSSPAASNGRILASPKARRLAREEGLDLSRLVAAGHPQPYHVADLETLRMMPSAGHDTDMPRVYLTASASGPRLGEFIARIDRLIGTSDRGHVLAAFAAGSLRVARGDDDICILVESSGKQRVFVNPDHSPLGVVTEGVGSPTLRVRVHPPDPSHEGDRDVPVLNVTGNETMSVTLEATPGLLSALIAQQLIDDFAGRLNEPLRHLL